MSRIYSCPSCHGILNPNRKVILRAELNEQRGLLLFSPRPGSYDVIIPPGFRLKKGDTVDFFCPLCSLNLRSAHDPTLAEVHVDEAGGRGATVAFSRTYGVHATYFITSEKVRSYGEHAHEGVNFFGEGRE
jgi:hypothetical protein